LHRNASATVCRLVCVTRPPLPRAPLLRRHYPPSSLLRAHARVLWPPCPFDLGLVGHWSSPLMPSTAGPPDRPSFDAVASSESVVPPATGARSVHLVGFFPSDNGLCQQEMARRAPSPPASDFSRAPIFDAAGISYDYDPLVHLPSWSLPRSNTRRGLCRSSLLGIRFLFPSRACYPDESTNFRCRIRTC